MNKSVYRSCRCHACRHMPSKIKGEQKKQAHRMMRAQTRQAISYGIYTGDFERVPAYISTMRRG
jgi:hypothetical protein